LNALIGAEFEIQGIKFRGMAECAPCYWMDRAFAPGAEQFLQNRGGLRAQILTDGVLRVDEL
jgi:MOSC domain-containing protein YiiM